MVELSHAGPFDRFVLRGTGPFTIDVPRRPMRVVTLDGGGAALWLGPDEFLLVVPEGAGASLARRVAESTGPLSLVDVSHRSLSFSLTGAEAPLLLNGAVPLDLSRDAFPPGMCARTLCDKAEIVLWRRSDTAWHLEIARSFVPYVQGLLTSIAAANAITLTGTGSGS